MNTNELIKSVNDRLAKHKVGKFFLELPPLARGVVVVGGGLVVVLVGSKLYRVIFPSAAQKANKQLENNIKSDINSFNKQGVRPTYPAAMYQTFANEIYADINGAVGNNYSGAEDILKKMMNNLDVALLIQSFGVRQYEFFGLPSWDMDLFTFVNYKLGSEWLGLSHAKITSINDDWAKKGIKYRI